MICHRLLTTFTAPISLLTRYLHSLPTSGLLKQLSRRQMQCYTAQQPLSFFPVSTCCWGNTTPNTAPNFTRIRFFTKISSTSLLQWIRNTLEKAFLVAEQYFYFWPKPEGGQMTRKLGKRIKNLNLQKGHFSREKWRLFHLLSVVNK